MRTNNKLTQKPQLRKHAVSTRLFLCDICGQEKSGKKFPVLDENWNKQSGLNQCEDCFKEDCFKEDWRIEYE